MSIELHVYSKIPELLRERVAAECLWHELPQELKWEVRFLADTDALELQGEGPLSDGIVLGWRPGAVDAAAIAEALRRGDSTELDRLTSAGLLASVYLSVVTPADSDEWEDIIESVKEDLDDEEHIEFLEEVKVFYSLETSATRNELSFSFQEELWRMIGVLSGGLAFDPQEGEFELLEDE